MFSERPPRGEMICQRFTLVNAAIIVSSLARPVGSALMRTDSLRMKGSCGMAIMRVRMISRGMVERS